MHHDLKLEINQSTRGNGEIVRFAPEHVIFFTIKVYLDSVLSAVFEYRKLPNSANDFICRSA